VERAYDRLSLTMIRRPKETPVWQLGRNDHLNSSISAFQPSGVTRLLKVSLSAASLEDYDDTRRLRKFIEVIAA